MKRVLKRSVTISLILSAALVPLASFAEDAGNGERNTISSSSASPSLNQSANTSKSSNGSAKKISTVIGVANMGLGAWNMQKFAASCSAFGGCNGAFLAQGILHFAMGAMSFKQASNHAGAGYSANITGVDTSAWSNPYGDPNLPGGGSSGKPSNGKISEYVPSGSLSKDKNLAALVNAGKFDDIKKALTTSGINGVRLDPKSGKIFDSNSGKTYDANKLGDAKGMENAGFSGSDIAAAMDASSKAEKAAMKKLGAEGIGAATAENGFSDGSAGANNPSLSYNDGAAGANGRNVASVDTAAYKVPGGQLAGLTKNFNGERIGVSAENIFNMMTRRYKTKEKQNTFFDPSEMIKMPQ